MLLWSKLTEYSCKCNDFKCLFVVYGLSCLIDKINIVNIGAKLVCSIVWQLMHLLGNLKVPDKILAQCTKTLCVCVMKGIGYKILPKQTAGATCCAI